MSEDRTPAAGRRAKLVLWLLALVGWLLSGYLGLRPKDEPPPLPVPMTAELAAEPVDYDGVAYEPHDHDAAHQAIEAGGRPWPVRRITYWIDYRGTERLMPPLSRSAIRESVRKAWAAWADELDIEPAEVLAEADALVRHRFAPIDGPLRTLAWSYLSDGTLRPVEQRYDTAERWTAGPPAPHLLSMPVVMAHEIGHGLCLGHDDVGAQALMAPQYSSLVTGPTPRDVERAVAAGYRRRCP